MLPFAAAQRLCASWWTLGPVVAFDSPYSGIRINGIAVRFLFLSTFRKDRVLQNFVDTRYFESHIVLQQLQLTSYEGFHVISYSEVGPIERNLNSKVFLRGL